MKSGTSSLNPYATSYVPISKREVTQAHHGQVSKASQISDNHNVWYGPGHAVESRQHKHSSSFIYTACTVSNHYGQGVYGSSTSHSSHDKIDKQTKEEGFDMDLEFLRMSFPDVSFESLVDVYAANNGDLENTFDMLNHLEFDVNPTNLPDTLEIGDVPESESSQKQKTVVGESSSGTSTSSSSASAIVAS
ncbi:Polyadenylate-binding protein-interacting protein 5 [Linum grandiflorum]